MQSLKTQLKLISHYLKFPSQIEKNWLFIENKFSPSPLPRMKMRKLEGLDEAQSDGEIDEEYGMIEDFFGSPN
jgi:hypothetical protein